MTPAPDQLLEFARRYTDAWCSQDPARVAENYAPDGSLTINDGAPSVGRAAITEAARTFMVAFPDMQVLMDDVVVHGDNAEYLDARRNEHRPRWDGAPDQDQRIRGVDDRRRWPHRFIARPL